MKKKFNLLDYNYMNPSLPLIGWLWEFMRRSEEYKKVYTLHKSFYSGKRNNKIQLGDFYYEGSPILYFTDPVSPKIKWHDTLDLSFIPSSVIDPIKVYNMKWGLDIANAYCDARGEHDRMRPLCPSLMDEYEWQLDCSKGNENIMLALIDISTPKDLESMLKSLKAELLEWRKRLCLDKIKAPKKTKKNRNDILNGAPIWKSYLIVYDLYMKCASYKKVADILSKVDFMNYLSEKNIENHFKKAGEMINSGYKKFLRKK